MNQIGTSIWPTGILAVLAVLSVLWLSYAVLIPGSLLLGVLPLVVVVTAFALSRRSTPA